MWRRAGGVWPDGVTGMSGHCKSVELGFLYVHNDLLVNLLINSARIYRPSFRETKPKTLVFSMKTRVLDLFSRKRGLYIRAEVNLKTGYIKMNGHAILFAFLVI